MISIIIPVYKAEPYIRKCLDSILVQTYEDYEVVMVNDGSPDNSVAICEEYVSKDSRFRLVNQKNAGPGAARNRGLDEARGKYVCFVDSDDWIESDYLACIMDQQYEDMDALFWGYTEDCPSGTVVRGAMAECAEGEACCDVILRLKRACSFGYTVGCRFKRSIIEDNKLRFFTDIKVHEDACFINMYCAHVLSIAVLDMVSYHYMQYTEQSLSRRFFPSDEVLRIAQHLADSSRHWFGKGELGQFEVYTYLSKLNLAVMNMYDRQDQPNKTWSQKLECISFVKNEVNNHYGALGNMVRTTHKIFRYVPVVLIDLIYRMK